MRISDNNNGRKSLDLTPMVDVTFLLLIFLVVTAFFTWQPTMTQSPLADKAAAPPEFEIGKEPRFGEVHVDQFKTLLLVADYGDPVEAPGDQEPGMRLRDLVQSTTADEVRITAHGNAWHEKVVTVCDAARNNQNRIDQGAA